MNIGIIGLGRMGEPMAHRLLGAGYRVRAFDVDDARRQPIEACGASWHASPADIAAVSEAIVLSVPGPAEVDAVIRGATGVLAGAKRGSVIIQTSTIGPPQSRQLAALCDAQGLHFLDAPISGGVEGAQAGTLVIMVGGDPAALERVRPALASFGKGIHHLGAAGTASAMKLVIQSIFLSQMAVFMESVAMGQAAGLSVDAMLDIIADSSAHHPAIGKRYAKLRDDDLTPRLTVNAALKDLGLAMATWSELGMDASVVGASTDAYRRTEEAGFGGKDVVALRKIYRRH